MDIFKRFEGIYLSPKALAQKELDRLVVAMADTNKDLQTSENEYLDCANRYLSHADRIYQRALDAFKDDDYERCKALVESAVVHLQIATLVVQSSADAAFEAGFTDESAQYLINHLLESIAKTKLTVESANYQVSSEVHKCLLRVVEISNQSVAALIDFEEEDARLSADAGILLLYWVLLQIELENDQPIFDLQLPNHTGNKFDVPMKQFANDMADCRKLFFQRGKTLAPRAKNHLTEAEKYFDQCLENIVDGDFDETETNIAAGTTELRLATELAARGAAKVLDDQETTDEEKPEERIKSFKSVAGRLINTARKTKIREPEIFEKRIDAAYHYYVRACQSLEEGTLVEAQRLAKAAYLDIDFARQIALTKNQPQYRDL
jgi:hypothetical protein